MSADHDAQVEYWNRVAGEKVFLHPLDMARVRSVADADAAVLDLGCGVGRLTAELTRQGFGRVTGADMAPAMLDLARARCPSATFVLTDGRTLPFEDESFDLVLLFSVLTCVISDAGQDALLAEIRRVLRPDGIVYISDLMMQDDERNRARYDEHAAEFAHYGTFRLPDGLVCRHFDAARVKQLTRGFKPVHLQRLHVNTMNGNAAAAFQIMARKA